MSAPGPRPAAACSSGWRRDIRNVQARKEVCEVIVFSVPLIPVGKGRPKASSFGGHARVYTPATTAQAEREFVSFANDHAPSEPIASAVIVRLRFVLPIPPSKPDWWKDAAALGLIAPRGPKDIDNLAKLVLDALNRSGRFWEDDAQVKVLEARKVYGERPETRVEIETVPEPSSKAEFTAWVDAGWVAHLAAMPDLFAERRKT